MYVTVDVAVVEMIIVGVETVVVEAVMPTHEQALAYAIALGQYVA